MIDDEPACQMSMDILLSDTGYNLISASGGISGLEYLEQHPKEVDLVLLDLMMPDMYGINVLKQIKANKAINNIPIIVQSGTNDNEEIEKAFMLGAIAYIRKPYQKKPNNRRIEGCCRLRFGIIFIYLIFKVDNPIIAKITAMIQNLVTTLDSLHPDFSKW